MPTFKKITKEHLTLDFKKLRKEQQTKPRVRQRVKGKEERVSLPVDKPLVGMREGGGLGGRVEAG